MKNFRDNDVKINNPHVLQVEDGKQGVIRPDVVAVKQSLDPAGLLNPGKLARLGAARPAGTRQQPADAGHPRKPHDLMVPGPVGR
ncbi:FAD/FMN-containing dehydrogenase [Klebsiella pneumoniae]|uniref:FAD/FMN-containing dehydrogenase n=1 Tax=Klebsiella pneumoniae TaxID=573 RepID=A0A378F5Q3_KLEPN|nr:FAD/FMN-containing dehydrogenase [Klebsiella pneumoniae]